MDGKAKALLRRSSRPPDLARSGRPGCAVNWKPAATTACPKRRPSPTTHPGVEIICTGLSTASTRFGDLTFLQAMSTPQRQLHRAHRLPRRPDGAGQPARGGRLPAQDPHRQAGQARPGRPEQGRRGAHHRGGEVRPRPQLQGGGRGRRRCRRQRRRRRGRGHRRAARAAPGGRRRRRRTRPGRERPPRDGVQRLRPGQDPHRTVPAAQPEGQGQEALADPLHLRPDRPPPRLRPAAGQEGHPAPDRRDQHRPGPHRARRADRPHRLPGRPARPGLPHPVQGEGLRVAGHDLLPARLLGLA